MSSSSKSLPKDALVMNAILKEMGVNEHDPRLINQMLEFTYRKCTMGSGAPLNLVKTEGVVRWSC